MATYAVTIPAARKTVLTDVERAVCGFSHKFTVLWSDLTSAGATTATDVVTLTLGASPAFWAVDKALMNVTTAFAGSGGLAVATGTTSSVAAFVASTSVLTVAAVGQAVGVPVLTNATATTSLSIVATATNSVSGSISALTAGQADIFLNILNTAPGGSIS